MMLDISRKFSLVNTPATGTPFMFHTMLKYEKGEGEEVKDLTTLPVKRFNVFQGCPTPGAGGDSMDDDSIRVWDRLKGMTFMPLLTPGEGAHRSSVASGAAGSHPSREGDCSGSTGIRGRQSGPSGEHSQHGVPC